MSLQPDRRACANAPDPRTFHASTHRCTPRRTCRHAHRRTRAHAQTARPRNPLSTTCYYLRSHTHTARRKKHRDIHTHAKDEVNPSFTVSCLGVGIMYAMTSWDTRKSRAGGACPFVRTHTAACASYHTVQASGGRLDSPPGSARHWHVDSATEGKRILTPSRRKGPRVVDAQARLLEAHDGVRLPSHSARHAVRRIP